MCSLITEYHVNIMLCFCYSITDTPNTEIYTLSLHDALPISDDRHARRHERNLSTSRAAPRDLPRWGRHARRQDRKSTRLNSSHRCISYAVFCLKKKNKSI